VLGTPSTLESSHAKAVSPSRNHLPTLGSNVTKQTSTPEIGEPQLSETPQNE